MGEVYVSHHILHPYNSLGKLYLNKPISEKNVVGSSLAVQWLRLGTFTAVAQIQSLVEELRSCKLHGGAKTP